MYTKDLNHKISLRLDDDTWDFVTKMSSELNLSPSGFIRMTLSSVKISMKGLVVSHADEQSLFDNKL